MLRKDREDWGITLHKWKAMLISSDAKKMWGEVKTCVGANSINAILFYVNSKHI